MLARARAAGVTTLLAIGSGPGPEKLDAAIPFAEQHDWIYATVGTHPHEAKELTPGHLEQLAKLAQHPRVIAYGEIGLDYFYDHSPRETQQRVFREQMDVAVKAKLPLVVRCRPAWPRHGLSDFFCGEFDVSESAEPSRCCESFAAGEPFD